MRSLIYILTLFIATLSTTVVAQEVFIHDVPFNTLTPQSMWGQGSAPNLNQNMDLFNETIGDNFGFGGCVSGPLGTSFGVGISGVMKMGFHCYIEMDGWNTGEVDVNYPIEVTATAPTNNSYDQGDIIDISTSYDVEPGWYLETTYPQAGTVALNFDVTVEVGLALEICFIDVLFGGPVSIIPNTVATLPIEIVGLDFTNGIEANFLTVGPVLGQTIGPLFTESVPAELNLSDVADLEDYGLTGWITAPNVVTNDDLINVVDLQACGVSQYLNLNLEIFQLLSNLGGYFSFLQFLSGNENFGPISVNWTLVTANLSTGIYNNQCFDFTPTVLGEYQFPVPIEYEIIDGVTGIAIGAPQVESLIEFELGNTIRMKYPCYFVDMDVEPLYKIIGTFRNHTWDEIPVDFWYAAIEFGIEMDDFEIIPALDIPYPCCDGWDCTFCDCLCCADICWTSTPSVSISDIFPFPLSYGFGPLLGPDTLNIATASYDWFNETWPLGGFEEYDNYPVMNLQASPLGVSNTFADIDCHGDATGSIDVSFTAITPALPYIYEWNNGMFTTEDISNLPAGPYELSAYDNNGCQLFTGATIQHPNQPITISASSKDISCNSGVSDGTIDLLIQGGTAPYVVSWNNGDVGVNINGLGVGSYLATVTDDKGCVDTINVDISQPSVLGQVAAITHVLCKDIAEGEIEINVFGGTAPYTYAWNSGQTIQDVNNLLAGDYTLTLSDINGCTNAVTHTVNEPATNVQLSISGVDILCKNDSTGSLDLLSTGGTPGYTFEWSNSQGLVLPFQSEDIIDIPADEYSVLVTDLNGCEERINFEIFEPAVELLTMPVLTQINCNGDATGVIDPDVYGGTAGYTFAWSDGSSNSTNSNLLAGTYNLLVTDANSCTFSEEYIIEEPTELVLATTFTNVLCFGESTGSAEVMASGATPNYTYSWNNGGVNSAISNIPAGNYSVDVTDDLGCIESIPVIIDQPVAPLSVSYVVTSIDCYANENGAVDMTPSGGTLPYTYTWATSGSVILAQTTEDIIDLPSDTYLLTLTDDNGCILNSSILVDQPIAPLSISGETLDVICVGGNNGSIDISVAGGTLDYTYAWDNGETTEDLTALLAGTYNVVVTDGNGCQISDSYTIEEPAEALVATIEFTDVTCFGGTDGYAISEVSGGTGAYTYDWSDGTSMENAYNLAAGTYTLTVTDDNGCTVFTGGDVFQPATFVDVDFVVLDVLCFEGSDGEISITPINGTAPYYFNWGDQNNILLSEEGQVLTGLTNGEYLIRVTDGKGCYHEELITVNEPTLLETSNVSVDVPCYDDELGIVDATIWGGTAPYSSVWSNNEVTEDVSDLGAGWYYYEVTDSHGCTVSDSAEVTQPSFIYVSSHSVAHVTCVDQTDGFLEIIVEGGVSPYTYLWNTGSTNDYVENLESGWYEVIYTDANACSDTVYYFVESSSSSCIDVPNTITPNGDDYNDTWFIENMHLYPNAEVAIFNKWGNELFKVNGEYVAWNGTVNGRPLPSEVYYYIILLNNEAGDKFTGTITIIR